MQKTAVADKMKGVEWLSEAEAILDGKHCSRSLAKAILDLPDEDLLDCLAAAFKIRQYFFGRGVRLNLIINAKSGHCAEDCGYCSQSVHVKTDIAEYSLVSKEVLMKGAKRAWELKAGTYCIVTSGRGPTKREVAAIADAVQEIKAAYPLKICACLGLLTEDQAEQLKRAGVDRYNHNINTSEAYHPEVVSTHQYSDRVRTVKHVQAKGISPCTGCIVGMAESDEDILDMAFALREMGVDSIPVNFFHPIPGTPLADRGVQRSLTPIFCLKVLMLFRFVCPDREIRIAGGREKQLRSLQPLGLFVANSIFVGDYLTTQGQAPEEDYAMLRDLGFSIESPKRGLSDQKRKEKS